MLVECIPNFSEGRRADVVDALAAAVRESPGVRLLDRHVDASHHRCVLTFAGEAEAVGAAAFAACARAADLIDLTGHAGAHPRIGAADVVPFVPLDATPMDACVRLAREAGRRIGSELGIPVYLYGEAAVRPERRALPAVRRGGFEGLREAIGRDPERDPDFGPRRIHPSAGATAVGARRPLVAWNVDLESRDLAAAKAIARAVRESGGGLPAVRALGLRMPERDCVQVSMNLVDVETTPVLRAYEAVERLAAERGIAVRSSELVGLIPRAALPAGWARRTKLAGGSEDRILENRLAGFV